MNSIGYTAILFRVSSGHFLFLQLTRQAGELTFNFYTKQYFNIS